MCKVNCPSGSRNDKAIGTNEVERAKRSRLMQDIRRKLGDSLRVASGQIDTSSDPIEEETEDELYQVWLGDSEDFGGFMTEESEDGEAEALSALVSEVKDQEFWAPYDDDDDIFDASGWGADWRAVSG